MLIQHQWTLQVAAEEFPVCSNSATSLLSGALRSLAVRKAIPNATRHGRHKWVSPCQSITGFIRTLANSSQIAYIRKLYGAPSPDYEPNNAYPRHPNTGRRWNARNLKCAVCVNHLCSCCGRPCCTYRQAFITLGNPLSNPLVKEQAFACMDQINRVFPDGKEVPTFLQCTNGGGCGRYVCPECIGICPLSICRDTQCRRCKKDPWAICEFHDSEQIQFRQDSTAQLLDEALE
jgi:hypothetical protein